MDITQIPEEDRVALKAALQTHIDAGEENPMIPLDVDLDGDGKADAIGLDENGELTVFSGVDLEETVYVSEGDDITGADDQQEVGE